MWKLGLSTPRKPRWGSSRQTDLHIPTSGPPVLVHSELLSRNTRGWAILEEQKSVLKVLEPVKPDAGALARSRSGCPLLPGSRLAAACSRRGPQSLQGRRQKGRPGPRAPSRTFCSDANLLMRQSLAPKHPLLCPLWGGFPTRGTCKPQHQRG